MFSTQAKRAASKTFGIANKSMLLKNNLNTSKITNKTGILFRVQRPLVFSQMINVREISKN